MQSLPQVPAAGCGRVQWEYCQKGSGIMCGELSPQDLLSLQQLHGGAGGQLSIADSLRETLSPFFPECLPECAVLASFCHLRIRWIACLLQLRVCPLQWNVTSWLMVMYPTRTCSMCCSLKQPPCASPASILEEEQDQAGCWSSTAFKPQCTK